jgi:hypothetical protein
MFVRLSARSRTRRLCEDTRIRIVLPFLLDLRRRKCKRISRTARPARKLHAHTRQKRNGERKRQSWLAKSVVLLVYSGRLQIVFSSAAGKHDEWKKTWNQEECRRDEKWMPTVDAECRRLKTCNEWMYRELMDERDFSSSICDLTSSFSRLGLQWYVQVLDRYTGWTLVSIRISIRLC